MNSRATIWEDRAANRAWSAAGVFLRPFQLGLAFPTVLYLAAMVVFVFRPPDVDFYYADRIAFGVLVFWVALRALALRKTVPWIAGISWPMLGLAGLAVFRALREPFDAQTWSLVASRFIVPFVLFHVAILIFRGAAARTQFEIFVLIVLGYLVFTAIAFLLDARSLIFPSFILDESLGHHVHRARGPFLQAVANGVALNLLGLLAFVLSERRRKLIFLLWLVLPVAVLATMTRAVWIAFAVSVVGVGLRLGWQHLRRVCVGFAAVGVLVGLLIGLSSSLQNSIWDRTEERGPVEVRMAVYEAGWAMFQERPLTGWSAGGMYAELARRMLGYRLRSFYVHNTYLSLLVEFGIPGLLLYAILFFNLFRVARARSGVDGGECGSLARLRRIWPILLGVYLFNAMFVDMVYQFVNGLLFTVAGMLCTSSEADS
jgi:O-antigen ligase